MKKLKILIIDDEISICESLSYIFEKKGYFVVTSANGKDAFIKVKEIKFDAALIDIKLPDVDGIEILKNFKKDFPEMVCVIITGYATVQNAVSALKQGADDYFIKPAPSDEVILRVEEALKKQHLKMKLRESEEKYRLITENARDLISIINEKYEIEYINEKTHEQLLGYLKDEYQKNYILDLIHPDDLKRFNSSLSELFDKGEVTEEIRVLTKNNGYKWFELKGNIFIDRFGRAKAITVSRDITERKLAEEEIKKRIMKFKLEDGKTYLVKEISLGLSIEAFKELLKIGRYGVIISRTPKEEFLDFIEFDFDHLWLAEKGQNNIPPNFKEIGKFVEKMYDKSALLIERLDYLISKNGFDATLSFIHTLRELSYLKNHILILSIDPDTLSKQNLRLLEKEAREIELRYMARLPEDLLEILRFIFKENNLGLKPSLSEIAQELHLSRPTVRKKIQVLNSSGYITQNIKGRKKVIELQERGKRLFSNHY
ncbi:MAG: response regulator [Candidatus Helarchaeota archaeon]